MRLPNVIPLVATWIKGNPLRTFLVVVALVGGWWFFFGDIEQPLLIKKDVKAQVGGLGVQKGVQAQSLLVAQKANEEDKAELKEQLQALPKITKQLSQMDEQNKAAAVEQSTKMTVLEGKITEQAVKIGVLTRQMQETKKRPSPSQKEEKKQASTSERPLQEFQAAHSLGKLEVFTNKHPQMPLRATDTLMPDTPYLPAGTFADARLATGVMAEGMQGRGTPVLLSLNAAWNPPLQIEGIGRNPTRTLAPFQGCFALAKALGNLATQRVDMQGYWLSCVLPNGEAFERPVKFFVAGEDGTFGVPCHMERHDSAVVAKAFFTSILQEASAAMAMARSQLVVTGSSGGQPFSGAQTGLTQLVQFFLAQAPQLAPTCWAQSGVHLKVVLLEPLELEGFPSTVTLAGGR